MKKRKRVSVYVCEGESEGERARERREGVREGERECVCVKERE